LTCRKEIEIQLRYSKISSALEENKIMVFISLTTHREEKIRVGRIELRSSVCQHHESPKKMMTHFKFNDLVLAQNKVRVMTINRNLPLENESIDSVQI
jgi:hypothetical protein